jgi:hypothetical protein
MTEPLRVFIGYDPREEIAFDVCRFSLLRHSSIPLKVTALRQDDMREQGLYLRNSIVRDGQRIDEQDGRPFSTDFSFTRFLVPALCDFEGWALFVDCDFLFMADVAELVPLMDPSKAALVCKQVHEPEATVKMDGIPQNKYTRKNWSSFMLLNCEHPDMRLLSPAIVNTKPGWFLHQFGWLDLRDIGDIPHAWNHISGVTQGAPKAVHYTAGGPWFSAYTECAYAKEWRTEYALACKEARKEAA